MKLIKLCGLVIESVCSRHFSVTVTGFSIQGFHSCGPTVEYLHVSEIEDILMSTLVSCFITFLLHTVFARWGCSLLDWYS